MAFQNLRTNNQVYILYKNNTPHLDVGKVTNVSIPVPKFGPNVYDLILDIQVDVNGNTTNFQKLPANADIADCGNNVVLTCSKDAMNNEIAAMKQRSQDIIDSVETHKEIVTNCETMLLVLNPEIAEKQKQQQENQELREEINQLKNLVQDFITKFN